MAGGPQFFFRGSSTKTIYSLPSFPALTLHRFKNQGLIFKKKMLGVFSICMTYFVVQIKHIFMEQVLIKVLFPQRVKDYQHHPAQSQGTQQSVISS